MSLIPDKRGNPVKIEFDWALSSEEGELFSAGTVIAECQTDAYSEA